MVIGKTPLGIMSNTQGWVVFARISPPIRKRDKEILLNTQPTIRFSSLSVDNGRFLVTF